MSAEEEDVKQPCDDAAACAGQDEQSGQDAEHYDNFKIISKKALADYKRAEELFLDFLATADVWSSEEVSSTIIDFHLVEKCRTKFRAFVKSFGAKVRFDPVDSAPRKQEYHGTVTVTRACKQQFLTKKPEVVRPGETAVSGECEASKKDNKPMLQCAAPTPITTGGQHIPYTPDDIFDTPGAFGRLPAALRDYLSPQYGFPMHPSPRDTTTGVPPMRSVKQEPVAGAQSRQHSDDLFDTVLARNTPGGGISTTEAKQDLKAWMDPMSQQQGEAHAAAATDMSDRQLARSSTFPSQGTPHAFSTQTLRRKRFSLQDGYTGLTATAGPAAGAGGSSMFPDASMLLGRQHDMSVAQCGYGSSAPLDDAHRRASCGLLPQSVHLEGLPSQAWLARRRTSAPNNAQRGDGFSGMSSDLALAAQRFLDSSSEYPEGAGVEQYDWPTPHMPAPPPAAVGVHRNRLTDASPRKSPRISYDTASMQCPQVGSSGDIFVSGMHAQSQPPLALAWQQQQQPQQPMHSAAHMMLRDASGKSEDLHAPYGTNRLSVTPLNVTPLSASLPLDVHSASAPLPHASHASAPLPGADFPTVPHQVHPHAALLGDHQHSTDSADIQGLYKLLAPEAAPQEHINPHGGTPNMSTQQYPAGGGPALKPAGHLHQHQQLPASPHGPSARGAPPGSGQHPGSAGHARMHGGGRNIGEAYAAVDGLCNGSFSIRSASSAAVSLPDVPPAALTPTDSWATANTTPSGPGASPADATLLHDCASKCGYEPPNPICYGPLPNPADPPPLLLDSGVLDGWSAEIATASSARDLFADTPGGMRRRRQSSNATMQAPVDELHDDGGLQRLVVRASDTSGASTEMPACGFPMEADAWPHEGFGFRGSLCKARRTSM